MKATKRCQQKNDITVEHNYCINIFNVVIDSHLMKLNNRFTMELFTLSSTLNPIDGFKSFKIDDICTLAQKFYAQAFTRNELDALRRQLEHYEYAIVRYSEFQTIDYLSELCQVFSETKKSEHFFLIDRLIRLVLTLLVFTTTKRDFSTMNLFKTRLYNKMDNDFLTDYMIIYIERKLMNLMKNLIK